MESTNALNPIPILWRNLLSFILWIFYTIIEKKINIYSFSMHVLEEECGINYPAKCIFQSGRWHGEIKRALILESEESALLAPQDYWKAWAFSVKYLWKPFLFLAQTLQCRMLFVLGVMNAKLLPHNFFLIFWLVISRGVFIFCLGKFFDFLPRY